MLILQKFVFDATQIYSSPISPNSNSGFTNYFVFSGIGGTILQQWIVCFSFENFKDNIGNDSFFNWGHYLWNSDFIYPEIDLEL
ncbi:MAG TPA: hypothetical protein VIV55_02595 [Flavobacterium sp.]